VTFRRAAFAAGTLLLAACVPALTPQQEWVMTNFQSCRLETGGWNAKLERVEPDGRMHLSASQTQSDVNRVMACLDQRWQAERRGQPAGGAAPGR
jgi:hypothetical protein